MRVTRSAGRIHGRRWSLLVLLLACSDGGTPPSGPLDLVERWPAAAAQEVGAAAVVSVSFSRGVKLPAAAVGALWLEQAGQPVAGDLTRPSPHTLVFTPADVLELGGTYTVRLGSGVVDLDGNPLAPESWQFTVAGRRLPRITADRMLAHLTALAHDTMRGRRFGSADELKAAGYMSTEFASYGLVPGAPNNGWLQYFPFGGGTSQNVLAVLPGRGSLRDEWVLLGGHYDHIGETAAGIHNGADDNASGTAMVLELARLLASHAAGGGFGAQDRRSVLFVGFGAEEAGLIGSFYFCNFPVMPLAAISGMVNLDMVGRLRANTLTVYGAYSASEWPALVTRHGGELQIVHSSALIGTDYRCFLNNRRPAVALFTGMHPEYHRPEDDVELINLPGMVAVGELAAALTLSVMLRARPLTTMLR
jgi:hypothetical protein